MLPDATKVPGYMEDAEPNEDRGVSPERRRLPGRRLVKVELGWEEVRLQERGPLSSGSPSGCRLQPGPVCAKACSVSSCLLGAISPSINLWAAGGFFWVPIYLFSCGVLPWPCQAWGVADGAGDWPWPKVTCSLGSLVRLGVPEGRVQV